MLTENRQTSVKRFYNLTELIRITCGFKNNHK